MSAQFTHVKAEELAKTQSVLTTANVLLVIQDMIAVLVRNYHFKFCFLAIGTHKPSMEQTYWAGPMHSIISPQKCHFL